MGLALRAEQVDAAQKLAGYVERARERGDLGPAFARLILPPRTGKTVIAAHLVERTALHSLFLVPTRTLVSQTVRELRARAPGTRVGSFCGEAKTVVDDGVNVATYQLVQRAWEERTLPEEIRSAQIVFADEGHRAMTRARMSVLRDAFSPSTVRIALTATPDYDAERTLCRFFPDLVHEMTLEEALALDLLAPLSVWVVEVDADASAVRILAGDYLEHEIGALMSAAPFFESARAFRYAPDNAALPALVACASRQQAADLRKFLERARPAGTPAPALVLGDTPPREREHILRAFRAGEIDTLVQVGVLIEGWNAPECKLLIDLAPSLSRVRATQKYFRVMTRLGEVEARIVVLMPASLPEFPILPMELFGRSFDDFDPGEVRPAEPGQTSSRSVSAGPVDAVEHVRVVQHVVLSERLTRPRLDPTRSDDVRAVLESARSFDPLWPPRLTTFLRMFFDHPLFLGRGESLLRWLRLPATHRAYRALLHRLYPEAAATAWLAQNGFVEAAGSSAADRRNLRQAIAEGRVDSGLEDGFRALAGGHGDPSPNPEELLIARERAEALRVLIDGLPRRHRKVLGYVMNGGSPAELAALLEISDGRVYQILNVIRRRLARRVSLAALTTGEDPASLWGRRPSSNWTLPDGGSCRRFLRQAGLREPAGARTRSASTKPSTPWHRW